MGKSKPWYKRFNAIRLDNNGKVDDVAISSDMFRLERMSDTVWWAAAYKGKRRTTFYIYLKDGKVVVDVVENELESKDDSEGGQK